MEYYFLICSREFKQTEVLELVPWVSILGVCLGIRITLLFVSKGSDRWTYSAFVQGIFASGG